MHHCCHVRYIYYIYCTALVAYNTNCNTLHYSAVWTVCIVHVCPTLDVIQELCVLMLAKSVWTTSTVTGDIIHTAPQWNCYISAGHVYNSLASCNIRRTKYTISAYKYIVCIIHVHVQNVDGWLVCIQCTYIIYTYTCP